MFWSKIKKELAKYGRVEEWGNPYMVLDNHDMICGLRLYINDEEIISIVSHKCSYGENNEFETMPPIHEDGRDGCVEGWLTEEDILNSLEDFMKRYYIEM